MGLNFTQMITVRAEDGQVIADMLEAWDDLQAGLDIMGYMGTRVLADRADPGRFVIIAEFASVDARVSAADEAAKNNNREETQEWARRLAEYVQGEPEYQHYDELYRTG